MLNKSKISHQISQFQHWLSSDWGMLDWYAHQTPERDYVPRKRKVAVHIDTTIRHAVQCVH